MSNKSDRLIQYKTKINHSFNSMKSSNNTINYSPIKKLSSNLDNFFSSEHTTLFPTSRNNNICKKRYFYSNRKKTNDNKKKETTFNSDKYIKIEINNRLKTMSQNDDLENNKNNITKIYKSLLNFKKKLIEKENELKKKEIKMKKFEENLKLNEKIYNINFIKYNEYMKNDSNSLINEFLKRKNQIEKKQKELDDKEAKIKAYEKIISEKTKFKKLQAKNLKNINFYQKEIKALTSRYEKNNNYIRLNKKKYFDTDFMSNMTERSSKSKNFFINKSYYSFRNFSQNKLNLSIKEKNNELKTIAMKFKKRAEQYKHLNNVKYFKIKNNNELSRNIEFINSLKNIMNQSK